MRNIFDIFAATLFGVLKELDTIELTVSYSMYLLELCSVYSTALN